MGPISFFGFLAFVLVSILITFRYIDGDHLPDYKQMSSEEEKEYDLLAICHNYALIVESKQDSLIQAGDVEEAITTGKGILVEEVLIDKTQLVYEV